MGFYVMPESWKMHLSIFITYLTWDKKQSNTSIKFYWKVWSLRVSNFPKHNIIRSIYLISVLYEQKFRRRMLFSEVAL